LPPLEEFSAYLEEIWSNRILTNKGPFHQQFEKELADYLGVRYLSVFSNGTLALVTALQALRIKGEVITTPFSFAATTHSLWWNNIKPVFADIEPGHFNLDPDKVEAAITPETTAILAVHVYGNPCDLERFQQIADTYGLRLIYDAAHAFGVRVNGNSVLNFGDLSILSFHATKVFNTFEGGAIVCQDEKTKNRIDFLKNFGFANEVTVIEPGINAKMNEFQAALGLLQLKYVDEYIAQRRAIAESYRQKLKGITGIRFLDDMPGVDHCYTYFPILVDAQQYGKSRDAVYEELKKNDIYGRRYFYPLISQFPTYRSLPSARRENLPMAEMVADQVICLPIFPDLEAGIIDEVRDILNR
jgi:dTDP-4-amino-4,6-dideoxygalactose transaminase